MDALTSCRQVKSSNDAFESHISQHKTWQGESGGWVVENFETKIPSPCVPARSLIHVCFSKELCLVRFFWSGVIYVVDLKRCSAPIHSRPIVLIVLVLNTVPLFSPYLGDDPMWLIFSRWAETTN